MKFWKSKHDPSGMYIYAGKDDGWMISFGILDEAHVVYVHAIKPRPSYGFDPRRGND